MHLRARQAIVYIHNTGGNATLERFMKEHEPAGGRLWEDLRSRDLVTVNGKGRICLTRAGSDVLAALDDPDESQKEQRI